MPISVTLLGDKNYLPERVNYPYVPQRQLNPRSMAQGSFTSAEVSGLALCSVRQAGSPASFSGRSATDWIVMRFQEAVCSLIIEVIAFCRILHHGFACESGFMKAHFL
jgi:hypothetical protein